MYTSITKISMHRYGDLRIYGNKLLFEKTFDVSFNILINIVLILMSRAPRVPTYL